MPFLADGGVSSGDITEVSPMGSGILHTLLDDNTGPLVHDILKDKVNKVSLRLAVYLNKIHLFC